MAKEVPDRFDVRSAARDALREHETTFYNLAATDAGVPLRPYPKPGH